MSILSNNDVHQLMNLYYEKTPDIPIPSFYCPFKRNIFDKDIIMHEIKYDNTIKKMNHHYIRFLKVLDNLKELVNTDINLNNKIERSDFLKKIENFYDENKQKLLDVDTVIDFKEQISSFSYFHTTNERLEGCRVLAKHFEVDISSHLNTIASMINNYSLKYDMNSPYKLKNELHQVHNNLGFFYNVSFLEEKEQIIEIKKLKKFVNSSDNIMNSVNLSLNNFLDLKSLKETVNSVSHELQKIYENIKLVSGHTYLLSEQVKEISGIKNKETYNFLMDKVIKESAQTKIDIEHGDYRSLIIMEDKSVLIKNKNNEYKALIFMHEIRLCVDHILKSDIEFMLRKSPTILKSYIQEIGENYFQFNQIKLTINTYLNNENILKSNKYNMIEKLANKLNWETLDDDMNAVILNHKVKQYAHSISSNKYNHLYNEDSYTIIKEMYELKIDESLLQDSLGKKMAAFKTPEEFNEALSKLLNSINQFTPEDIKYKAEQSDALIVSFENDVMILEIKNYKQSQLLGSSSWCISRDEYYFNSYTENRQHQYFIFDFNKPSTDNTSMVGLTLTERGSVSTSHLKNDDYYRQCEIKLKDEINNILINQSEIYKNLELKQHQNKIVI